MRGMDVGVRSPRARGRGCVPSPVYAKASVCAEASVFAFRYAETSRRGKQGICPSIFF